MTTQYESYQAFEKLLDKKILSDVIANAESASSEEDSLTEREDHLSGYSLGGHHPGFIG